MKLVLPLSLLSLSLVSSVPAHADELPVPAVSPLPSPDRVEEAQRARFSVGRFFVESLAGLVVGSAVSYGAFRAFCGREFCDNGLFAGFAANLVATPLAVSMTGWSMGGQGSIGSAFMGELMGVSAGSGVTALGPEAALGLGLTLGPFASATFFEASSHVRSRTIAGGGLELRPYLTPTVSPTGALGGALGLTGQF